MGMGYKIKCPKCGKSFEWKKGCGFLGVYARYCDRCGRPMRTARAGEPDPEDLICKCGGTFLTDAPVRCPKCKTVVENLDECETMEFCWD